MSLSISDGLVYSPVPKLLFILGEYILWLDTFIYIVELHL